MDGPKLIPDVRRDLRPKDLGANPSVKKLDTSIHHGGHHGFKRGLGQTIITLVQSRFYLKDFAGYGWLGLHPLGNGQHIIISWVRKGGPAQVGVVKNLWAANFVSFLVKPYLVIRQAN